VGNVIANLLFAWVSAETTMQSGTEKQSFQGWVESAIKDTTDLFYAKALKILKEEAKDKMAQTAGFAEWYMDSIMQDTAGMAGAEINRRIIGIAKVVDIAGIIDPKQRETAERICVLCAKEFILKRGEKYRKGSDYVDTIHEITAFVNG
jgi:5-methylthioribose kinase